MLAMAQLGSSLQNFCANIWFSLSCTSFGRGAGSVSQKTSTVLRVVSTTTRQSSQCSRWRSSSRTSSGSSSPSRYSEILSTTCRHRIAGILSEILSQFLTQLQARAQKPRLYHWNAQPKHRRSLLNRELLNVSQSEDGP